MEEKHRCQKGRRIVYGKGERKGEGGLRLGRGEKEGKCQGRELWVPGRAVWGDIKGKGALGIIKREKPRTRDP